MKYFLSLIYYSTKCFFFQLSSAENKALNAVGLKGMTEMAIDRAIKEWEEKTCVKFVPRTNEKDYEIGRAHV